MPPKKKKKGKKKKKAQKVDPNALTEVDRTFYELTITDLNRKLARLRSLTTELETQNEELKTNLQQLDEDRNDIIIYLKRLLQEKSDEIAELQERLKGLEEARQEETEQFEAKITELENEYKRMHEQLTSEIKLLEGKLNSLEEFRIQRDELMKKFEDQEVAMEEQEKRHKNELYEIERKFIIGKDKLKKDMEARLLQLSSDFQEATELRIAATTHRVIRENIAINNELDSMLVTQDRLQRENSDIKSKDRDLKQHVDLYESMRRKILGKVKIQHQIIEKLLNEHEIMEKKLAKYLNVEKELTETCSSLQKSNQKINALSHRIRILEQNVHALKCKELTLRTDLNNFEDENERLNTVLAQAVYCIKEVLEIKDSSADVSLLISKRENLLTHLFNLLTESTKKRARKPSLDTIGSVTAAYQRGDLGFVPKSASRRSSMLTFRHIEAQTGPSFDEFLAVTKGEEHEEDQSIEFVQVLEEESNEEEGFELEEISDAYFNEEEDTLEDSMLDLDEDAFEESRAVQLSKLKFSREAGLDKSGEDKKAESGSRTDNVLTETGSKSSVKEDESPTETTE